MDISKATTQALDALEDAREELVHYNRMWQLRWAAFAISVLSVLAGILIGVYGSYTGVDTSGGAAAFIILGLAGAPSAGVWIYTAYDSQPHRTHPRHPRRAVILADRAYRDVLDRQG